MAQFKKVLPTSHSGSFQAISRLNFNCAKCSGHYRAKSFCKILDGKMDILQHTDLLTTL